MPIENETKYILRTDFDKQNILYDALIALCPRKQLITQAYLSKRARIRHIIEDNSERYVFTYKKRLNENDQLEIETTISVEDYQNLLSVSECQLYKIRYKYADNEFNWDIDFLYEESTTQSPVYCVIAECEMPVGIKRPTRIPEFIKSGIIFIPKRKDDRFSNRNLCDIPKTKKIIENLVNNNL